MKTHLSIYCTLFLGLFALLGCAGECVLSEGKCPGGCQEVTARPVVGDSSDACIGDDEILGCTEKGPGTLQDACVVSPEGTIYGTGGPSAGRLIEDGYTSCSDEQSETLTGLRRCQ